MDAQDLKNFRLMVGLSQRRMADALGYKERQYMKMELGRAKIRPCISLACAAYALGIRDYSGPAAQEAWSKTNGNAKVE